MVFVGLRWQLQAELAGAGEALREAPVIDIHDFAHLEVHLVEDVVLDGWAVAAPEAREEYALLAVRPLYRVDEFLSFSRVYLNFGIGAPVDIACEAPAIHP